MDMSIKRKQGKMAETYSQIPNFHCSEAAFQPAPPLRSHKFKFTFFFESDPPPQSRNMANGQCRFFVAKAIHLKKAAAYKYKARLMLGGFEFIIQFRIWGTIDWAYGLLV